MKLNVTDQTVTFPCPLNKLKGRLMDAIGLNFETPDGKYILDANMAEWIAKNAIMSMYNSDRSFIYNKALKKWYESNIEVNEHEVVLPKKLHKVNAKINNHLEEAIHALFEKMIRSEAPEKKQTPYVNDSIYVLIRDWASERGIYESGDSKTQYVKLMEEAGELAKAILKQDKAEIKDAIGDMIVVLTNLAHLEGMLVEECISSAYNEIKNRKGSMQNGTFVKKTSINIHDGATITLD